MTVDVGLVTRSDRESNNAASALKKTPAQLRVLGITRALHSADRRRLVGA